MKQLFLVLTCLSALTALPCHAHNQTVRAAEEQDNRREVIVHVDTTNNRNNVIVRRTRPHQEPLGHRLCTGMHICCFFTIFISMTTLLACVAYPLFKQSKV